MEIFVFKVGVGLKDPMQYLLGLKSRIAQSTHAVLYTVTIKCANSDTRRRTITNINIEYKTCIECVLKMYHVHCTLYNDIFLERENPCQASPQFTNSYYRLQVSMKLILKHCVMKGTNIQVNFQRENTA